MLDTFILICAGLAAYIGAVNGSQMWDDKIRQKFSYPRLSGWQKFKLRLKMPTRYWWAFVAFTVASFALGIVKVHTDNIDKDNNRKAVEGQIDKATRATKLQDSVTLVSFVKTVTEGLGKYDLKLETENGHLKRIVHIFDSTQKSTDYPDLTLADIDHDMMKFQWNGDTAAIRLYLYNFSNNPAKHIHVDVYMIYAKGNQYFHRAKIFRSLRDADVGPGKLLAIESIRSFFRKDFPAGYVCVFILKGYYWDATHTLQQNFKYIVECDPFTGSARRVTIDGVDIMDTVKYCRPLFLE